MHYFYDVPSVLYLFVHKFDYVVEEICFIYKIDVVERIGKNINSPVPMNTFDTEFLEFIILL